MKKATNFSVDAKTWLDYAEYDLKTAKWNFEGEIYTSTCYASQQTAEKALKALLLSKGEVIPKVHSLDRLISILKELSIDTSEIEGKAKILDVYYISARYPGQYGGPEGLYSKDEAQEAIASAEAVLIFVKENGDFNK